MSTILKQPDAFSFSGNIKPFVISSTAEVVFELSQATTSGRIIVLSEKFQPGADNLVTIPLNGIVDLLLDITVPDNLDIVNEQPLAVGNFFTMVDGVASPFVAIKGGVAEMQEMASEWLSSHFLTWQPQHKFIPQASPEWLGIYPVVNGSIILKAYYGNGSTADTTYAYLTKDKLYSINTSWSVVSDWLVSEGKGSDVIAWDVWFVIPGGTVKIAPQRYQLRNRGEEENGFIWSNTLGGIDTISFSGSSEEDKKLEHKNAIYADDAISEYKIDKYRAITQYTGYLDLEECRWVEDFFYSTKKYVIRADGTLQRIAITESEIINSSQNDEFDHRFTYRLAADTNLLNLHRTLEPLQPPEGLNDFFLSELLSGLTSALYQDNLLMAVQSPFAQGWQNLSFSQLWGGALPTLVDGTTITVVNGKLKVLVGTDGTFGGSANSVTWEELKIYIDNLTNANVIKDTRTELIGGAILWKEGLTYNSLNISYKILGVNYTALDDEFPLDAADPVLSRIDLFYADSFGNVCVMKGTPAVNPSTPILDATQLFIMQVLITPGATEPEGIDVDIVYDENIEWVTSETHDDLVTVAFNSTITPKTGSRRTQVAIAIPDSVVSTPTHYLGEDYQGGRVFLIDSTGKKGLIAAKEDTANGVFWASIAGGGQSTGGREKAIGTGQANTTKMLAQGKTLDHAVKYCNNLIVDGYDDWFMPSQAELLAMYLRRYEIGGFANKMYWCSTEYDYKRGESVNFANGVADHWDKNRAFDVRAIRAFDDVALPTDQPVLYFTPKRTTMTFASPVTVAAKDGVLSLNLRSSMVWRHNSTLKIESFLGGTKTGMTTLSPSASMLGYQSADDQWQLVAIPMSKFSANHETLDAFKISLIGSWPNNIDFGIDDIRFQHTEIATAGVVVAPGTYGSTKKSAVVTVNAQGVVTNIVEVDTNPVDEIMIGAVDGINRIFNTSMAYETGTITVFLNGFKERDFIEISDRQIELAVAPKNTGFIDLIETIYIKK